MCWFSELVPSYVCKVGGLNFGRYGTQSHSSGLRASHNYLLQLIPLGWGCNLSLDAFNDLSIMFFLIIIALGIIVILVGQELS